MGNISRRRLFGWLGAFAAAAPFVAVAARPTRLVNMFADYTPPQRFDLLHGAKTFGPSFKVGDLITYNDEPPRIVIAVSQSDG